MHLLEDLKSFADDIQVVTLLERSLGVVEHYVDFVLFEGDVLHRLELLLEFPQVVVESLGFLTDRVHVTCANSA